MWNLSTNEMIHKINAHDNPVCALAYSEDFLFSGSLKSIKVWYDSTYRSMLINIITLVVLRMCLVSVYFFCIQCLAKLH